VVRPQDVRTVLAVVASNPAGRLLAWRHLRAHWLIFQNMFGEGSFTMGSLITAVVGHFSNHFDYEEVRHPSFQFVIGFIMNESKDLVLIPTSFHNLT
jgi:multisubunit Na+/H+ antiporter MnhE subunit